MSTSAPSSVDAGAASPVADAAWDSAARTLSTRLAGTVSEADVRRWEAALAGALARVEEGGVFKLLYDLRFYEPADLDAHRAMRTVVPLLLAAHGFRTAILDLFEGADLPLTTTRGIRCLAAACVHHDAGKMTEYERRLARPTERFFTDRAEAEAWLASVSIEG
ncbi:MAG TPA: hypothetical protein VFR81_23780 [Longimicrobium sp.]|nr:hypothetical protein [Longimicrobium sp.]